MAGLMMCAGSQQRRHTVTTVEASQRLLAALYSRVLLRVCRPSYSLDTHLDLLLAQSDPARLRFSH